MSSNAMLITAAIISIISITTQPVHASECVTTETLSGPGAELHYDDGIQIRYKREGDVLHLTANESPHNDSWSSKPRVALGPHGLLRLNWDGTATGNGRIEHTHWPETHMLFPNSDTTFETTRTSWRLDVKGSRQVDPVAIEPLEFHFGSTTVLEHGSCVYDGLFLNTQTTLVSGGQPMRLSGIWLTELRLFVINRTWREGHFDIARDIATFAAIELE